MSKQSIIYFDSEKKREEFLAKWQDNPYVSYRALEPVINVDFGISWPVLAVSWECD